MTIVAVAIVGVLLLGADPGRAATTVLVMTGDAARDGERLDSIFAPSASRDTATFIGGTSAGLRTRRGAAEGGAARRPWRCGTRRRELRVPRQPSRAE